MRVKTLLLLACFPLLSVAESAVLLDKTIAVVNNGVITESELNTQVDMVRQQIKSKKMALPEAKVLRKQVLNHLIDVDLQMQMAKNNSITIESAELDDALNKIAQGNKISLTTLRQEVQKQGLSWSTYRENIRKEMLLSRLQQQAVSKDVVISTQQIEDYMKTYSRDAMEHQTFHVKNIVVSLKEEPTPEQVKQAKAKAQSLLAKIAKGEDFSNLALAESSGEYALEGGDLGERHLAELPEIFAEKVATMKVGDVSEPIRTGNGFQLIKLVSVGGKAQHHEVTKTRVRHILLKEDANTTTAQARKQIYNLYQQIKSGRDFAQLAKHYSLDSASATKGGDLGWVTAEDLVPQFADAMKALPLHKVSKPVKTPFGWHLIEVVSRKKVDDNEAYQRQQVRQFLQQRKFNEAVQNWQQHIRADAFIQVLDKAIA